MPKDENIKSNKEKEIISTNHKVLLDFNINSVVKNLALDHDNIFDKILKDTENGIENIRQFIFFYFGKKL